MTRYQIYDNGVRETIEAHSDERARELAEDWLRTGYPPEGDTTSWVSASLSRLGEDGEEVWTYRERIKVAIEPEEPDCSDGEPDHDWRAPYEIVGGIRENPGVWGSGGGVLIVECCTLCGCRRETDTWAQDPNDGEQGLTSVTYRPGHYAEALAGADGDE